MERAGVIQIRPKPDGRGSLYEPTAAGRDAWSVLKALGHWGDQWTEVEDEHANTAMILWLWCQNYVRRETLPDQRVTVRFDYPDRFGRSARDWLLIEHGDMHRCRFDPGFGDDVVVLVEDPVALARWHLGLIGWSTALHAGVRLSGDRELRRGLPTWNTAPETHRQRRVQQAAATSSEGEEATVAKVVVIWWNIGGLWELVNRRAMGLPGRAVRRNRHTGRKAGSWPQANGDPNPSTGRSASCSASASTNRPYL